jgi:PBSX family phage terminase large subunit
MAGIGNKQRKILAFPYTGYDALICDGAIRSGKSSLMTYAFVEDAMERFDGQRFGICGKTVDSTKKNVITPYLSMVLPREKYVIKWKQQDKVMVVTQGDRQNVFEIFGGKDESSFALIQGRTLAGVLFDEVALQPRSFVEQAMARCSVDGSRFWFNCNPGPPNHWFYLEWILKAKEKNALHLHFLLEDNPSLSEKIIARYKAMYSGTFYQRYILGEWVAAEGLVYQFGEDNITDEIPPGKEYYISVDYGTLNPFSAGLWSVTGAKAVRIGEYYYSGRSNQSMKTDEEYCDEVDRLAAEKTIRQVIVDPSAASFIAALRRRGYTVKPADNEVMDGIRRVALYLQQGNIKIHRNCADSIQEFGLYRWDDKSQEDKVVKENDHAMDEIRYFCNTVMRIKVKKADDGDYIPIWN